MLFNSVEFIFLFLPVCLAGYALLGRLKDHRIVIAWLVLCSAFYYARWKAPDLDWTPRFLLIILLSIVVNFICGRALLDSRSSGPRWRRNSILAAGILFNFGLLAYFKYTGFFLTQINAFLGSKWPIPAIVLPLAFSFHTFQQHAYLIDAYRGHAARYSPLHYTLFVLFFPQLLAGPIVHHHEMLPQLASHRIGRLRARHRAVGLSIFIIGLMKKVLIADRIAQSVGPVFSAAAAGRSLSFGDAWLGALSYTFQLYFDFSAYSDMAIGVARMLGLRLPLNFNSPYKSASIIDFWRRWHMTLSRWLRDYLYIPLGGNRKGEFRRWINLLITMLLGGLWHGAGWTFIFWGGLHGAYLGINHLWRKVRRADDRAPRAGRRAESRPANWPAHIAGVLLTFLAVTVAWVFFRAPDFHTAATILRAMFGGSGFALSSSFGDRDEAILLAILLLIVWLLPNTQQVMNRFRPALGYRRARKNPAGILLWRPNLWWSTSLGIGAIIALMHLWRISEFIYYQF